MKNEENLGPKFFIALDLVTKRVNEGNLVDEYLFKVNNKDTRKTSTQQTFSCSKSTIETLDKGVKHNKS